jgi:hypothetical protein
MVARRGWLEDEAIDSREDEELTDEAHGFAAA